jgi:hypothetical protein
MVSLYKRNAFLSRKFCNKTAQKMKFRQNYRYFQSLRHSLRYAETESAVTVRFFGCKNISKQ